MSDIARIERLESLAPPPEQLGSALIEATDAGKRLASALAVLERGLGKASPARAAQYAPQLMVLQERVVALTAEMRTVRLWSLEMAHFLQSWHPVAPSFAPDGGSSMGRW